MGKVFLFAVCVAVFAVCAQSGPFVPKGMVQTHRLNTLSAQPNQKAFVFGESKWDYESDTWDNTVNYVNYDGESPSMKVVGSGEDPIHSRSDSSPLLLEDGSIIFLSSRTGISQVFVAPANDLSKAYQITDFPIDVDTIKVSANTLAFTAMLYPGTSMSGTAKIDKERSQRWDTTQEWKKGFVRRWDAFWDGKYSHLLVVPLSVDSNGKYSIDPSQVVDVMGALDGDCPSRPFGSEDEYSISPDGKIIAFTTQVGRDMPYSTDLNVYIFHRQTGVRECISCDNPATDTSPAFHPDGRRLFYLAMKRPGYESDTLNIKIYDLLTKETTDFDPNNDISWGPVKFSPDGSRMYSSSDDVNGTQFFELKPEGPAKIFEGQNGTFPALTFAACIDDASKQCPVFLLQKFDLPSEVFMLDSKQTLKQMTNQNAEFMANTSFTEATLYTYKGANNDDIYGWLHKPYGFEEGKKYPLVMYIHGGPEYAWVNEFHYRWNPQLIAARGYAVFEPNPHGSTCSSLGSAFTRSIRNNWGGWPFEDIMKAMDFLRQFDWIDVDNAAAMGASYGGYMMNWLNAKTDNFRCIICHDGLFDTTAMYYETDELYFMTDEFNGVPTDPESSFVKYSPSTYAYNMSTPELVIHGGVDFRISEVQAFGVFNNLQRLGVESKLVRFPSENHFVLNPNNSLYWHKIVFDWLKKYLGQ